MQSTGSVAVLTSGGLDSAILLGEMAAEHAMVHPLYMTCGHFWEAVEKEYLCQYMNALRATSLQPLKVLEMPVGDLYADHWGIRGEDVPDALTPDEAVYLPGRNVLLLTKAMVWCHLHDVPAVALGTLGSNPFPDATPAFFDGCERLVNQAVGGSVRVLRPYARLHKTEVMHRGRRFPLEHTFSCIRPVGKLHCGRCNKCNERQRAFADAEMMDPTIYA